MRVKNASWEDRVRAKLTEMSTDLFRYPEISAPLHLQDERAAH